MRKILIVPTGKVEEFQQMATDNEVPEIVEGIPPRLAGLYKEEDLPIIHTEEPEPPKPPSEIELLQQDLGALLLESANNKVRIAELETFTGDLILEIAILKAGGAS